MKRYERRKRVECAGARRLEMEASTIMKPFGQMSIEEQMRVLLYGELNGEKMVVDPEIRKASLSRLIVSARAKLQEAQSVVDEANPEGHNWDVYCDPEGARRSAVEIYDEWSSIRNNWRKLVEDAEKVTGE